MKRNMFSMFAGFVGAMIFTSFIGWGGWTSGTAKKLMPNATIGDGSGVVTIIDTAYTEAPVVVGDNTVEGTGIIFKVYSGTTNLGGMLLKGAAANVRMMIRNENAPSGSRVMSLTHNATNNAIIVQAVSDAYNWVRNVATFSYDGRFGVGTASPDETFEIEWVSGGTDVEIGRGATDPDVTFITLRSPNGTKYYITVDDLGNLVTSTTKP